MATEYMRAKTDAEREALARKIARLRLDGTPWDGIQTVLQRNQQRLLAAAHLPPGVCLFWNAVPWDLDGRNPTSSDLEVGAGYLLDLLGLMTEPPTVVALALLGCPRGTAPARRACSAR